MVLNHLLLLRPAKRIIQNLHTDPRLQGNGFFHPASGLSKIYLNDNQIKFCFQKSQIDDVPGMLVNVPGVLDDAPGVVGDYPGEIVNNPVLIDSPAKELANHPRV